MKQICFVLILITVFSSGCNQNLTDEFPATFEQTYSVAGNQEANRIIALSDGILICGTSTVGSTKQAFLIKTDFGGNQIWKRDYEIGTEGFGIKFTADNSFVLVGSFLTIPQSKNLLMMKLDLNGIMLWQRTFGGNLSDTGRDIIELENGGYMLIGTTQSFGAGSASMYVVKTDSEGNEDWSRTFGGSGLDGGSELVQTSSFEVALLGFTNSFGAGDRDIYLQTVSTGGDSLASFTIGGNGYEESQAISKTSDGGFIMSNHSASLEPQHSVLATKLNSNFQRDWEVEFGTNSAHEGGEGVFADSEGNFIFVGRTNSFGNDEQVYIIKTTSTGEVMEELNYGEAGDQRGNDIVEHNGSYYIVGNSTVNGDSDVLLIKRPI
ncbi:MAG: hypothetical protein ACI8P5_001886 [Bacteroidia bacterium]|jgi:hypothetical protein